MDLFAGFQEYVFKTRNGKAGGGGIAAEIGRVQHRCSCHAYCCCCSGAARKRDASTSTHDLSTYFWHTEGDGVGISSSNTFDEEDRCSCRTGSNCGRKQCSSCLHSEPSQCFDAAAQKTMCDASTSSFDLTTYVWGTEGDPYTTDSGVDEDSTAGGFVHDLGDVDNHGKGWRGVGRKRTIAAATVGFSVGSNGGELASAPRKKKRRIGNQRE